MCGRPASAAVTVRMAGERSSRALVAARLSLADEGEANSPYPFATKE